MNCLTPHLIPFLTGWLILATTAVAAAAGAPQPRFEATVSKEKTSGHAVDVDVDLRGGPRTIEERLAAVDAVTVDGIAEYYQRYPIDRDGFFISIGPRDWPPLNGE